MFHSRPTPEINKHIKFGKSTNVLHVNLDCQTNTWQQMYKMVKIIENAGHTII